MPSSVLALEIPFTASLASHRDAVECHTRLVSDL